ncbi:hypothetical protein [Haliscomenobacter sp.]|uniref:hypothetical protein n=1 Tax=Haliscomenobacter sp. TaxID=2717303 RepID=UPI003364F5EA
MKLNFVGTILGLFGLLVFLFSCGEKPPLKLTTTQRDQIDTLYLRKLNQEGMALEMDSLCKATREAKIQVLVDSMLKARRAEEEELRLKYSK